MKWATPERVSVTKDFKFPSSTTARLKKTGGGSYMTVGLHVAKWIELNCVLTTAKFANQPFKLLPWQRRFLAELFEVVADDDGGWKLKHRWCLLGLPKKNGKSELIAALGLFFLLGTDEIDPRVFVAASTEEQANMVFGPVSFMARQSTRIAPLVTPKARLVVSNTSRGGFVKRLAAVGGANDGANVYVALIDEFHEWDQNKRDVWNIITNGTVMRDEPMIIQITTAGYDEDTLCYEWYLNGKAMLEGDVDDDTFYFCWFEADEDDDWMDLSIVEKCNPSFGLIMGEDFYADQQKRKAENTYRRYYLNQWTEQEEIWAAAQKWDELAGEPDMRTSARTYCGIDIGRKIDNSALVLVQIHQDDDGVYRAHLSHKIWANPYGKGDSRRSKWRMNIFDVDKAVHETFEEFKTPSGYDEDESRRLDGPVFAYDPHLYGSHADKLADDGINLQEFPQTDTQMVPASQLLFEWIMADRIVHDGDPAARRHIRSVVAKEKERGWRISKPVGTSKHVDYAVALAMALRVAIANENIDDSSDLQIW